MTAFCWWAGKPTLLFFLDWWLWIHLAYKNDFYYIDEELTFWRLHKESYIFKGKKPVFYPLQVRAYRDVYEKTINR